MSGVAELAVAVGARASCEALGVPRASYYRWTSPPSPPRLPKDLVRVPSPRALSTQEQQGVLDTLHSERFQDRSPAHVVAELLGEGIWLSSERTMYHILAAHGETQERRRQRSHPAYVNPQLVATGLNQVWSWDISKIHGLPRGLWFHLFVLLDIFSRCVVDWTLTRRPSATVAGHLLQETLPKHPIEPGPLAVHNDRGPEFVAERHRQAVRHPRRDPVVLPSADLQ